MTTDEKNEKKEQTEINEGNVRILSPEEDAVYNGITIDSGNVDENKTYKTGDYLKNFKINLSGNTLMSKIILGLVITGIVFFVLFVALPIILVILGVILAVWIILSFFQRR